MRKFALVIICSLILVVMIAFNYLLLDRENIQKNIETLEDSKASNNAINAALGEKLSVLESENNDLLDKTAKLEEVKKFLEEDKNQLQRDIIEIKKRLQHKNRVINQLKYEIDPEILKQPIIKWVEAINNNNYESAYNLQTGNVGINSKYAGLLEYAKAYKESVKNIEIVSVELVKNEQELENEGDIAFIVVFEIEKVETELNTQVNFAEGENRLYVTVDYDEERVGWVISGMDVPLEA